MPVRQAISHSSSRARAKPSRPPVSATNSANGAMRILSKCQGNSRLMLAVAASLTAPLIKDTGAEAGGIHFFGPSSIGKTTTGRVAAAMWGSEAGLRQCSAHGLRKAAAARAAENGATTHQLMAMFGWLNLAEAE